MAAKQRLVEDLEKPLKDEVSHVIITNQGNGMGTGAHKNADQKTISSSLSREIIRMTSVATTKLLACAEKQTSPSKTLPKICPINLFDNFACILQCLYYVNE